MTDFQHNTIHREPFTEVTHRMQQSHNVVDVLECKPNQKKVRHDCHWYSATIKYGGGRSRICCFESHWHFAASSVQVCSDASGTPLLGVTPECWRWALWTSRTRSVTGITPSRKKSRVPFSLHLNGALMNCGTRRMAEIESWAPWEENLSCSRVQVSDTYRKRGWGTLRTGHHSITGHVHTGTSTPAVQ